MTASKLLELEPGNLLPFTHSLNHVDLVANGALIGRGELIEIGDELGIRVIELG